MTTQKKTRKKPRLLSAVLAVFFAIASLFLITPPRPTHATPSTSEETTTSAPSEDPEKSTDSTKKTEEEPVNTCADQAGAISWIVCPIAKSTAKAIDAIYSLFGDILAVEPFSTDSNSPIRLVWSYIRSITNIIFIIFLLIVVYSQLTGIGITNYGIKHILPRLIIAAILVNLSWIICSFAIDVSNVFGISLRGVFSNIKDTALAAGTIKSSADINWFSAFGVIATGGTIAGLGIAATGGLGAFFWMIIPALISALIAVVAGLITVACRQAFVAILLMISPLAFVAYLIPNTEKWFNKWKETLYKMLIFFPMFSFVFGAADLVGWTIITAAIHGSTIDAFGLIIGLAVQVIPLFFAFSLMKMSGTVLNTVNGALRKVGNPIQKAAGGLADGQRELRRQKYLASKPRDFELTKRFAQKTSDRKIRQASDAATYADVVKKRGEAYAAEYKDRRGKVTRRGERLYDAQKQTFASQSVIDRKAGDFNAGLAAYAGSAAQKRRLTKADDETVLAADQMKYEQSRNEQIEYENVTGYFERTRRATMFHIDPNATVEGGEPLNAEDKARYERMLKTMEGNEHNALRIDADASYSFSAQNRITSSKFAELFNTAAPTQQLVDILQSLTKSKDAYKYIDSITSGLRALNMRGDTDITSEQVQKITHDITSSLYADGGIKLGTHASQTLASFCMFDVKDNDPFLRRFGKYINLETAHVYNKIEGREPRHNLNVTLEEYIKGEYIETEADGITPLTNPDGSYVIKQSNKDMVTLLKGTSFSGVERTAYDNMAQSIRTAYTDTNGVCDTNAFRSKMEQVYNSILPNTIGDVLGYPSGSEQITSWAQFLTGLKTQKDGSFKKLWEDQGSAYFGMSPEYFLKFTESYLKNQVPNQVASLKSDVFGNIRALFRFKAAQDYQVATGISREDKIIEYLSEEGITDLAALEISDPSTASAAKKRAEEKADDFYDTLDSSSNQAVGAKQHFRDSLGANVFVRLQNSARSGALNNAKGPVVDWLGIKFNNKNNDNTDTGPAPSPEPVQHTFDNSLRQNLTGNLMQLYNLSLNDPGSYYDTAIDILQNYDLDDIIRTFSGYYRNNPTATTAELHNYLIGLIGNI